MVITMLIKNIMELKNNLAAYNCKTYDTPTGCSLEIKPFFNNIVIRVEAPSLDEAIEKCIIILDHLHYF